METVLQGSHEDEVFAPKVGFACAWASHAVYAAIYSAKPEKTRVSKREELTEGENLLLTLPL